MWVKTAIATQRNTSVQHKPAGRNTSLSSVSAMIPFRASHMQCPMTVILALHLATCLAQIDVGDQKPGRFHWVSGVVPMGLNMPVTALNSGTTGDFDGNGFDDILVIGNMGGFVAWNSTQGLAPFRQITEMGMDGSRCEWDSTLQLVWLERRTPHGIEALRGAHLLRSLGTDFAPRALRSDAMRAEDGDDRWVGLPPNRIDFGCAQDPYYVGRA